MRFYVPQRGIEGVSSVSEVQSIIKPFKESAGTSVCPDVTSLVQMCRLWTQM